MTIRTAWNENWQILRLIRLMIVIFQNLSLFCDRLFQRNGHIQYPYIDSFFIMMPHEICNKLIIASIKPQSILTINNVFSQLVNNKLVILMSINFSQSFTAQDIRQGLISIRNTQIELLNQLKNQTKAAKNHTPFKNNKKASELNANREISYSSSNREERSVSILNLDGQKSSLSNEQTKSSNSGLKSVQERQMEDQLELLNKQNKILQSDFQKLKDNFHTQKATTQDLQNSILVLADFYYGIINQILSNESLSSAKHYLQKEFSAKQRILHHKVKSHVQMIAERLQQQQKARIINGNKKYNSEQDIAKQLIELKTQVSLLFKSNNKDQMVLQEISLLRQQSQRKSKDIKELQLSISKLESSNRQLNATLLKERNQRKKNQEEGQSLKKEVVNLEQKQKKIIFYIKDLQHKRLTLQKTLKDKEKLLEVDKETIKKLNQTIGILRADIQILKTQVNDLQKNLHKDNQQENLKYQDKERQIINKIHDLQSLITKAEQQNRMLKIQNSQLQKNHWLLMEQNRKLSQMFKAQQQGRKMKVLKLNTAVDHLWQVKEVQYQNIHTMLSHLNR